MMLAARRLRSESDAVLIAGVGAGDLSGLATLFDRHGADVRRLVARLGIAPGDLDDVVQETFLDVVRAAVRFDPSVASARAWLFGLAAMIVRRRRRSLGRALARLGAWMREPRPEWAPSPAERFELAADAARAAAALARLAPAKRETFVLVALEELSCAEAAAALDIPIATVWSRLHYARSELKARLTEGAS